MGVEFFVACTKEENDSIKNDAKAVRQHLFLVRFSLHLIDALF